MKNPLAVIMISSLFFFNIQSYGKPIRNNLFILSHSSPNKNNKLGSSLNGNWCFKDKNNSSFVLSLLVIKDSIYGSYAYTKDNGSFLNAERGDKDYAFVINKKLLINNKPVYIGIINYNTIDSKTVSVELTYHKQSMTIDWKLNAAVPKSIASLPLSIRLIKCN